MASSELRTFRFAVGTPESPQSWLWRMWVQGDDVYLGARDALRGFKVSLHQSNIWRIALIRKEADGSDRVIVKWNRPQELLPGWTPSIGILISSLQPERPFPPKTIKDDRIVWFQPPQEGSRFVFKVLFSRAGYSENDLKRVSASRDRLVARFIKKNGEVVWLTVQERELSSFELQKIHEVRAKMKIHLRPGASEDSLFFARGLLVVSEDVPTASTQPTTFDIPLGKENLGIPREPETAKESSKGIPGMTYRSTGWFLRLK